MEMVDEGEEEKGRKSSWREEERSGMYVCIGNTCIITVFNLYYNKASTGCVIYSNSKKYKL